MCVILAQQSFLQNDLSPTEKHILLILCVHANPTTKEFFISIPRLMIDSGYSKNTVDKIMKKLRESKKIIYTGEKVGKRKLIPVYKVNFLITPACGVDKSLITPSHELITPSGGVLNNPTTWGTERILERKKEREDFLKNLTQEEFSHVQAYRKTRCPLPSNLEYLKTKLDQFLVQSS